jgi:hypothetical protein
MPWLRIEIDLDEIPDGAQEPNEVSVILRECADWIEKRKEWKTPTNSGKNLRNFESTVVGKLTIR